MFMLRYFGDADEAQRIVIEGGSESTDHFVWGPDAQPPEAVAALRTSFAENLRKFLTRRKAKRVLRMMAQDYQERQQDVQ